MDRLEFERPDGQAYRPALDRAVYARGKIDGESRCRPRTGRIEAGRSGFNFVLVTDLLYFVASRYYRYAGISFDSTYVEARLSGRPTQRVKTQVLLEAR